jgi:hypothetical protein
MAINLRTEDPINNRPRTDIPLTGCLKEMDSCFMVLKNEEDLMTIVENIDPITDVSIKETE